MKRESNEVDERKKEMKYDETNREKKRRKKERRKKIKILIFLES